MPATRPARRFRAAALALACAFALAGSGCATGPSTVGGPMQDHEWAGLPGPQWYVALPVLVLWEGVAYGLDVISLPVLLPAYYATGDEDLALPLTHLSEDVFAEALGVGPPPR